MFSSRNVVWTAGRDGVVRRFILYGNNVVGGDGGSEGIIREAAVTHLAADWVARRHPPPTKNTHPPTTTSTTTTTTTTTTAVLAAIFHGAKLIFQSLDSQRTVAEINCGGGHRSWALQANKYVVYIKVGKVFELV